MESSETHEPSYYEVALTNRQVLIAFVALLTSIVAAFLSGVWIGRGGAPASRTATAITAAAAQTSANADAPLEQLTFFSGKDPGSRTASGNPPNPPNPPNAVNAANAPKPVVVQPPPAIAPASAGENVVSTADSAADDSATEAMRRNLDATMAANRTTPATTAPASSPPAAATTPAPATVTPVVGTRTTNRPATPKAASPPSAASTPAKANRPAPAAASGRMYVQVYSSTNGTRAKEIVAQLKKAGYAVNVAESKKGAATSYRVRVGPYGDKAKGDAAAAKLRREFRLETWVTDSP
ncbi:MAG: SPOR domain-containing protein [Thermoanaerobaculia bacterium]